MAYNRAYVGGLLEGEKGQKRGQKWSTVPGDVIKDAISCLLIHHPLANEHARRRRSQFPTAEETVAVAHVILEAAFKHFTGGVAAGRRGKEIARTLQTAGNTNMCITNCRKYKATALWVAIILHLYKHKNNPKPSV